MNDAIVSDRQILNLTDALVFEKTGCHLGDAQRALLQAAWSGERQSYDQIAESCGYSAHYLRKHIGPSLWQLLSNVVGEKVTKLNCKRVIERRLASSSSRVNAPDVAVLTEAFGVSPPPNLLVSNLAPDASMPYQDWGEAAHVETCYGRQDELATLTQWLTGDRCRLIGVFGVGGMGKTHLVTYLAQHVTGFDCVIWRSLHNAPPLSALLTDVLNALSRSPYLQIIPAQPSIQTLLDRLRTQRCLLILDNLETLLQGGRSSGHYRPGYEDYGQLLQRVGETQHASCLIITSREKTKEFTLLAGEYQTTRAFSLKGLTVQGGQQILQAKGIIQESERASYELVHRYGGNPLALKIISTTIQDLFGGSVGAFLHQETAILAEISELLDQHFNRLSPMEIAALQGLAIARDPITLNTLCDDIFPTPSRRQIRDALTSLGQRSLLEHHDGLLSLQPVVMEYVSEKLIGAIATEIQHPNAPFRSLNQHSLLKAEAKDYIRDIQARLLLQPLLDQLLQPFKTPDALSKHLTTLLHTHQQRNPLEPGYLAGNLLNLLLHLGTDLSGYDCSNLTIWQAYLETANLNGVNFANSDLSTSVLMETFASTLSVAFSPDGAYFATATTDNDICLWQTQDGRKVLVYQGHQGWVHSVAFSPKDAILASGSEDKTIRVWDIQTGQCLKTLRGHQDWVWSVAFSPDGTLLASSGNDQTVRVWDVATGTCLQVLKGHENWVWSVAFNADQTLLVSGSNDKTLKIWDATTGLLLKTLPDHRDWVQSVAFSPIANLLASGSRDHTIKLWDAATGTCLATLEGHTNWVQSVTFDPSGTWLASASNDKTLKIWNVETGVCLRTFHCSIQDIWSVAFSPDSKAVILGGSDQTVQLWDVHTGQCLKTLRGHISGILSLDVSACGTHLVTGGSDRTVRIWDLAQGHAVLTLRGHSSWVRSVAFSPQSSRVASGSSDHTIRIWDSTSGQCLRVLRGHDSWVRSVQFSPDGLTLVSGSTDHTVRLWDVCTGECLHSLQGHTSWVRCVVYSPSGSPEHIASSSDDQTIRIWDSHSGQCLRVLTGHTSGIWAVAFSPDGRFLASGGDDCVIKIWDVATGHCLQTLEGHQNWIQAIAFSPDGTCLASGSNDQTIRLWHLPTGQQQQCIHSHHNRIWAIAYSVQENSEGVHETVLISGSEDETIRLWNPTTGQCIKSMRAQRPCEGMNIQGVKGLRETQKEALRALGAIEPSPQQDS
ncbi:MAG TPA: NB-ARC domain-containing protein [Candidatus Obscuribacterales bacterium]